MTGVLLITGGGRGIGAAAARLAAAAGYSVAVNYRARRDAAEALVAEIAAAGGEAAAFAADVAEESQVVALFDAVEARLGALTALVNSAGFRGGDASAPDGGQRCRHHAVLPRGGAPTVKWGQFTISNWK